MKLLNKTIRSYLVYSFIILLVTVPLFYLMVRRVLLHAVDKSLKSQLHDIRVNLPSIHSAGELETWARLDKDIRLSSSDSYFKDSLYTSFVGSNIKRHHPDPYRQLATCIAVEGKQYRLVISSSLVESEDLLGSIVLVEALLLIALMAGMIWINRSISRKIWAPFYLTLTKIQEYELNKQAAISLKETNTDEFNDLNKSLKNLLNRNRDIYLAQKEFTENAAHEMQTPLAIFQGQLELLLQTSPLTEEQALLINSLENNNQRLSKLNRSLLLLAKIENDEYQPTEEVDVAELAEKFTGSYLPYIQKKNIQLEEDYGSHILVRANRSLIEILVSNLVSNAVRYNVPGGKIRIEAGETSFTIKNTGNPEGLATDKLYQRFSRQPGQQEGFGLGLAIVQRICGIYRFSINYRHENGLHVFSVVFSAPESIHYEK
jgi:signal transduction histidine kinase